MKKGESLCYDCLQNMSLSYALRPYLEYHQGVRVHLCELARCLAQIESGRADNFSSYITKLERFARVLKQAVHAEEAILFSFITEEIDFHEPVDFLQNEHRLMKQMVDDLIFEGTILSLSKKREVTFQKAFIGRSWQMVDWLRQHLYQEEHGLFSIVDYRLNDLQKHKLYERTKCLN
ncbi:hemerythrin domain-containing protein [Bacillus taeanensis]|uniref:Hemerythrin-like domain-containing protein n=1 Tax=Bacillus taeanensis TaxID=273032 RepID=A0A366XU41_9BACI|nr:hemerythrin domain-containing protein [Bacillus taeanensis]RBW68665.1 hypothetical protein DS031_15005 [Bacillus taeanensis]